MDIVAEGLAYPEGPIIMADGSIIVVEIMGGRLTRCWGDRKEVICQTGGSPNGAAIGPDGAVWICNHDPFLASEDRKPIGSCAPDNGRIERIDLATGRMERVYDSCDGLSLQSPNDLVFDSTGRLWFTDVGAGQDAARKPGGLFTCLPDGSAITAANRNSMCYNGVGLSPDQTQVYVANTVDPLIHRFDNRAQAQAPFALASPPPPVWFDSLAVTAAGNVCVASLAQGGITIVSPQGALSFRELPGKPYVSNIAFGGADMRDAYVTLSPLGQVARVRWDEPGLVLAFNG